MPEAPASYELRYLLLFWDDLNEAVSYAADTMHNPQAAERLLDRTEQAILRHRGNLLAGTVYRGSYGGPTTYRWFAVGNYMVFSVVDGNVMEVRRFLFGSRDLTRMPL